MVVFEYFRYIDNVEIWIDKKKIDIKRVVLGENGGIAFWLRILWRRVDIRLIELFLAIFVFLNYVVRRNLIFITNLWFFKFLICWKWLFYRKILKKDLSISVIVLEFV